MVDKREALLDRARRIRALVVDVDGVLTDAGLYYSARGETLKRFSARDGFAVKLAQSEGIRIGVLSGRIAPPLRVRLRHLGIPAEFVVEGSRNKARDIERLARGLALSLAEIAFLGDDVPDLPALRLVGLAACPADACPEVVARCHFVSTAAGGNGAVREVVELLLKARGRWDDVVAAWECGEPTFATHGDHEHDGRSS